MVVSTREVVVLVRVESATGEAVDAAFADLAARVHWSLPKLRFGDVRILDKQVHVRRIAERPPTRKAPNA